MNCQECIDTLKIKSFCNLKRRQFLDKIINDNNSDINNIKSILLDNNIENIIFEINILDKIKKYYNEKIKLVEYIKIKSDEEVIFVGDIHGDINAMINAFSMFEKNSHIVFLGDIVDRGENSLKCIILLFYFKILYPERVHIIRGNHECNITSKIYGFYDEIKKKISEQNNAILLHNKICEIFSHIPIICILQNEKNLYRICGVHGCIDKETNLLLIENMEHMLKNSINECWNDPNNSSILYDEPSERGCGYSVSKNNILSWMKNNHINCIFRSHAVVEKGYNLSFADKTYMIHIFSQPNYCNMYDNKASIAIVNNDFTKCEIIVYDEKNYFF
jgi:serine/threonine-protein phosphatase PP1 catalytic subunit